MILVSLLLRVYHLRISGHYNCSIVATIRCLHSRKIVTYAQIFLWDAYARQGKLSTSEIFQLAQSAGKLLESRLKGLFSAQFMEICFILALYFHFPDLYVSLLVLLPQITNLF